MKEEMDRRDFLKFSVAAGVVLAAGEGFMAGKKAQAATRLTEVDRLAVWVITDNYYDTLRPNRKIMQQYRIGPGTSIHAEHGLSYFVETVVNGKTSTCMFDFGCDSAGVMNNMSLLGLDLGKVNAFCLSHGHFDHFYGAAGILKANRSKIQAGIPCYVGEEAFERRYVVYPGAKQPTDLGQLKREDIEAYGPKVIVVKKPTEIIPGAYFTGDIDRVTGYEKVPPNLLIKRGDKLEHDDFRGEQALFFVVKGKGLVVLSSCAHAGIVNTIKHMQKIAGTDRIHTVLGGFHLINAKPEIIQKTISDIQAMRPEYIAPTHCTGFEAVEAFGKAMPKEFVLNTAGAKYSFAV